MMRHIVATPAIGWCSRCAVSWDQSMIAVRVGPDTRPTRLVCGDCILAMAEQVRDEAAKRKDTETLRRMA